MKKLGLIDILVILSIITASVALAYKFFEPKNDKYEFSGDEIYKCSWIANQILNKGFPLKAYVVGKYHNRDFNGTVIIYKAIGGRLYGIYNNETVTIGGRLAYKEDIRAEKIILIPVGNAIILKNLNPIKTKNFTELYKKLDSYLS